MRDLENKIFTPDNPRLSRLFDHLENPDSILAEASQGIEIYDLVFFDVRVISVMKRLINQIVQASYKVIPVSESRVHKEQAEFIQNWLDDTLHLDTVTKDLLTPAMIYGYQPFEKIWKLKNQHWFMVAIHPFHPKHSRFNSQSQLEISVFKNRRRSWINTEKVHPFKFGSLGWGSNATPYGQGLARVLYRYCYIKNEMLKGWANFGDLYAQPKPFIRFDRTQGIAEDEIDPKVSVAKKIATQIYRKAFGVFSKEYEPHFMETKNSNPDVYKELLAYIDQHISLLILQNIKTTESNSVGGSYSASLESAEMEQKMLEALAPQYYHFITEDLIRDMMVINFGEEVEIPQVKLHIEKQNDPKLMLEALAYARRFNNPPPISKNQFYAITGWQEPRNQQDKLELSKLQSTLESVESKEVSFSAPEEKNPLTQEQELLFTEIEKATSQKEIEALLEEWKYKNISTVDMERLLFEADAAGRIEVYQSDSKES